MIFVSGRTFLVARASCACGFTARAICLECASLLLPLAVSKRQLEKVFMVLGEMDLGIVPALITTIIQAIVVDNQIFIVTVITEVDICITPANFMHITMVD